MIPGCSIPVCSMCQHTSRQRFSFSELFLDSAHPLAPQEKTSAGLKLWNEDVEDEWIEHEDFFKRSLWAFKSNRAVCPHFRYPSVIPPKNAYLNRFELVEPGDCSIYPRMIW